MSIDRDERAIRMADRAETMLEAGLIDHAAELIEAAMKLNPDLAHGRLLQARVELGRHQPRHALRALSAERLAHPDDEPSPESVLLQARALAQAGRLELATKCAQRLTEQYPDDERGHRLLSGILTARGMNDQAIESLREVRRLSPGDRGTSRTLAELVEPSNPREAAELLLEDYRKAQSAEVLLRLARVYRASGQYRDADEAMRTVLSRCPHETGLWIEAGELAMVLGDHTTARARLARASELDDHPQARIALATLDLQAGRFAKAGRRLWHVMRHGHRDREVICGMMVASLAAGKHRLAKRIIRKLGTGVSRAERREASARWWTHAAMGRATLLASGEVRLSEQVDSPLRRLLGHTTPLLAQHARDCPRHADAHYHHANCLASLQQVDEARDAVQQAVTINPRYRAALSLRDRLGSDGRETPLPAAA